MQQKKNKQALMIDLDESWSVSDDTAFFQNGFVSKKRCHVPKRISKNQKQYDWSIRYRRRLGAVLHYLKVTKLPTSKQIKIFVGLKGYLCSVYKNS